MTTDIQTLLNLACIKYTGHPLPALSYGDNNWKFEYDAAPVVPRSLYHLCRKRAVWAPHPYFNPLHLYYPSNDFTVSVCRKLIVGELEHREKILTGYYLKQARLQLMKTLNQYGGNYYPTLEIPNKSKTVYTEKSVKSIDCDILSNKLRKFKGSDTFTQCLDVRKTQQAIENLYIMKLLAIGMSASCHKAKVLIRFGDSNYPIYIHFDCGTIADKLFYPWIHGHPATQQNWSVSYRAGRRMTRFDIYKKYRGKEEDPLTPEDYVRIYNNKISYKNNYIEKKLIENFTHP